MDANDRGTSVRQDVLRADRRQQLLALLAIAAGAALLYYLLRSGLPHLLALADAGRIRRRWICMGFLTTVLLLVAPVVLVGMQNRRRGRQAITSGQFPPAGTRVLRDTRILRGPQAVMLGKVQVVLGTLLIVAGLALLAVTGYGLILLW